MKKNWNDAIFGHVRVTIIGQMTEPFINQCIRESITIWDIERLDDHQIGCSLLLHDVKKIKPILKATHCRIHFTGRFGGPFWMNRLLSRSGIIAGIGLFLVILFLLSNVVWNIEIVGADPKVEHQIQTLLKKMNVHVGSIDVLLPPIEKIEADLSTELKKVTWVGVSKDGTTYHIEVVQKELPKAEKRSGPRDLIATKKATIHEVYVEKGMSVVEPDQVVRPGQLLVSGAIGGEDDPKYIAAKGKVIGETWYHSVTDIPLNTAYKTYTGATYKKHQLSFFGWAVPLWGLQTHPYKHFDKEVISKPFHFLFWDLPISYKKVIYRETDRAERHLTETEALKAGKQDARRQLQAQLPDDSEIVSEDVGSKKLIDGNLKLTIFFVVYEDIAKPKAFIPSDRKEKLLEKEKKEKQSNH